MSCSFILKNGIKCKNASKKQIKDIEYCTRHYNILIQNNDYSTISINNILSELNINISDIIFINKGSFSHVYKILINDKYYALKIQYLNDNSKNIIYYEYLLLSQHLNNSDYIVKLYNNNNKKYYYKNNEYAFLLTELLFETLEEKNQRYKFNIDEIKFIGIQLIKAIEYIHNQKYLYIDLKPENIMFICENNNIIKLIDFNCCSKYINHLSEFYDNSLLKNPIGNMIFSSININKSYSGIRIDDIESVLWIILYLLNYEIINNLKKMKKNNKIILAKENFIKNINFEINIHDFIINFINELKNYNNINNKKPDYNKFINILE